MKCEICDQEIKTIYLGKRLGTVVKDDEGKKHWICDDCQAKHRTKREELRALGQ